MDSSGLRFYSPAGGWKGKTFEIIFRPQISLEQQGILVKILLVKIKNIYCVVKGYYVRLYMLRNLKNLLGTEEQDKAKSESTTVSEQKRIHEEGTKEWGEKRECSEVSEVKVKEEQEEGEGNGELEESANRKRPTNKRSDASNAPKKCSDLIVMGIPYDFDESALKQFFEPFGNVEFSEVRASARSKPKGI